MCQYPYHAVARFVSLTRSRICLQVAPSQSTLPSSDAPGLFLPAEQFFLSLVEVAFGQGEDESRLLLGQWREALG